MEKKDKETESGVSIQIPVKIKLEALEKVLQKKLVGFKIQKKENSKQFGEILSFTLAHGGKDYDLFIHQHVLMKTMLFKSKKISFSVHLKFGYNQGKQELIIEDYKVDGEQKSWLTSRLLKIIMTLLMKKKFFGNSNLFLAPKISELLNHLNKKLENVIEVKKGISLFGSVDNFKVINLYFKNDGLILLLMMKGNLAAEVSEIELNI